MHHRRSFLAAGCAGAATWLVRPALVQAWPSRPLRLVAPYPPGGAVDLAGRLIADALRERLGQPVVVENRGGAGGNIGVGAVAKSAADGYTLAATAVNSLAINQFIYDRLPFDAERDLVPVSLGWEAPLVLVVPAGHVPARSVQEFVAWAKGNPAVSAMAAPASARRCTSPRRCSAAAPGSTARMCPSAAVPRRSRRCCGATPASRWTTCPR